MIIVDHHKYMDVDRRTGTSSLEQVANLLGHSLSPEEMMIAINDRSFLYGLGDLGVAHDEMVKFQREISDSAGDFQEIERLSERMKTGERVQLRDLNGQLHEVYVTREGNGKIGNFGAAAAMLTFPRVANVLIVTENGLRFTGSGDLVDALEAAFKPAESRAKSHYRGGDSARSGYWGFTGFSYDYKDEAFKLIDEKLVSKSEAFPNGVFRERPKPEPRIDYRSSSGSTWEPPRGRLSAPMYLEEKARLEERKSWFQKSLDRELQELRSRESDPERASRKEADARRYYAEEQLRIDRQLADLERRQTQSPEFVKPGDLRYTERRLAEVLDYQTRFPQLLARARDAQERRYLEAQAPRLEHDIVKARADLDRVWVQAIKNLEHDLSNIHTDPYYARRGPEAVAAMQRDLVEQLALGKRTHEEYLRSKPREEARPNVVNRILNRTGIQRPTCEGLF
ncbi:MAG: hypothetical protein AAB250_17530 [Bdellovibrionota bacterium]